MDMRPQPVALCMTSNKGETRVLKGEGDRDGRDGG